MTTAGLLAVAAPSADSLRRALAVVVLALLLLGVAAAASRGWRSRAARQALIPAPQAPPLDLGAAALTVTGSYVGTTLAGQFLERVVAHGLGGPARASLAVYHRGLVLSRDGRDPVFVPAADVVGAGVSAGMSGKVVGRPELLLVRWRCGDYELDTGVRPADRAQRAGLAELADQLATVLGSGPDVAVVATGERRSQ